MKRRVAVGGEEKHRYQLEGLCGRGETELEGLCGRGETESVLLVGRKHIGRALTGDQ